MPDEPAKNAAIETVREREKRTLTGREQKKQGLVVELFTRLVKEKPLGTIGLLITLLLIVVAIFADELAPYGMNTIHLADRLSPPSFKYLLGTDNLGRDLLSRIIYGSRISIYVGLGSSVLNIIGAVVIGVFSGFVLGTPDLIIQRFVDAWLCFPPLFVYLSVMAILGPGLTQVMVVLGLATAIRTSRTVRSTVIAIRQNMYVEAARAIGNPPIRTMIRHILPNVMAPVIIIFSIHVGQMILQESTLSFLGFGVPPPNPSWGGMLSGTGRQYMYEAPWMMIWPGVALSAVVYGVNMLGDAVRDILDPRLRGGLGRYTGGKIKELMVKAREQKA